MLKSLTLKRWTSFLLALALVFTMLPLQQASAAITFTFDSYSTDPESPTQVNGDTIDLKGTYNGIASNTITYKVEQIVDGKVVAVPTSKILPMYDHWKTIDDVNPMRRNAIAHFFEHYKDLEKGKWVKVLGWEGIDAARKEIVDGIASYQKSAA